MPTLPHLRRALRAAEPRAIGTVREAVGYGRAHGLGSSLPDQVRGYRAARDFGFGLLPDGFRLDGLVVDVGANRGDFTATVRRLEPRSRVIAVEPVPANAAHLRERFAADAGVTVAEQAVSDRAGTSTLNITAGSEFASLQAPLDDLEATYGADSRVVGTAEVPTTTLDALVSEPVRLLKIDVQGHELPLLAGATATLARTDAVLLEVLFVPHYEGDATFGALDAALRERDFTMVGLLPAQTRGLPVLYADACYVPAARAA